MRGFYGYGFSGAPGYAMVAGFPWLGILACLIGLGLVAALVFFIVKAGRNRPVEKDGAFALLSERFAKGEISKEEYLESKDFLKNN